MDSSKKGGKKSNKPSKSKSNKSSKRQSTNKKSVVATVENVLQGKLETKFATQAFIADKVSVYGSGLNYNGTSLLNGWCSGYSNGYGITPIVTAGTGSGSRIGTKIQPKSMYLRYHINALSTTDSTTGALNINPFKGIPFRVRVIIFRHRYAQDDYGQSNICDVGNGNADLGSDIDTYFRPYNKEEYKVVYSKDHRMSAIRHISGAGGATQTTENMPPNCKSFVIAKARIPLPAKLLYNDTVVTNYPTNFAYFLAVCVVNEDSSVITTTQQRITLSAESGMYYTDA